MTQKNKSRNDKRTTRDLSRGCLGITDPTQLLGAKIKDYSIGQSYYVKSEDQDKIESIKDELYSELRKRINDDKYLGTHAKCKTIQYRDNWVPLKKYRRVLEIEQTTYHSLIITTLGRFLVNGNNFYFAIDSYILGRLNCGAVFIHVLIVLFFIWLLFSFLGFMGLGQILWSLLLFVVFWIYLKLFWSKFIFTFIHYRNFKKALTLNLNLFEKENIFDIDDCHRFLMSLAPLFFDAMIETFKKHGLEIAENLEKEKEAIVNIHNNINNSTNVLDTGGGNVVSSTIGGIADKLKTVFK